MAVWEPQVEVLVPQREPHNQVDQLAVLVVSSGCTVGHVPFNLAPVFSHFLKRTLNRGTAEIIGDKLYCGRVYGLEVSCVYCLTGQGIN